jgi:hypothetical protein
VSCVTDVRWCQTAYAMHSLPERNKLLLETARFCSAQARIVCDRAPVVDGRA